MTEQEWLDSSDPDSMLEELRASKMNRSKWGRRKLRLFGCGCCARVKRLMSERGQRWLELGEQNADALINMEQLRRVGMEHIGAVDGQNAEHIADLSAWFTIGPNVMITAQAAARSASDAIGTETWHQRADSRAARDSERSEQTRLLREIIGNPFRTVSANLSLLSWNDSTVPKIAQTIYEERRFKDLPILSDALEEAGCTNADILDHCRSEGPHVRGCWVVDLILGKK